MSDLTKFAFSQRIFVEAHPIPNFTKIRPVRTAFMHAGRTDVTLDTTSSISDFSLRTRMRLTNASDLTIQGQKVCRGLITTNRRRCRASFLTFPGLNTSFVDITGHSNQFHRRGYPFHQATHNYSKTADTVGHESLLRIRKKKKSTRARFFNNFAKLSPINLLTATGDMEIFPSMQFEITR